MHSRVELIFYAEPDLDRWVPFDRYPRRVIRRIVRKRKMSGFRRRLDYLGRGLREIGVKYRVNDFHALDENTGQSVGLLGKQYLLDRWKWKNRLVVGPTLLDHPMDRPDLFEAFNAKLYLVAGPWMKAMFEPYWGERVQMWPIGIDTDLWTDFAKESKTTDFLIYEKFLWDRESNRARILAPILDTLARRGFTWSHILCGKYSEAEYLSRLRHVRYMIFLCEHETQGQAYQEALSCNVPVLAWNQGFWLDPKAKRYESRPIPASSVPFFDSECGETFRSILEFPAALDQLLGRRYCPREFVLRNLGLAQSARRYVEFLHRAESAS
jgi:hypothetical protein